MPDGPGSGVLYKGLESGVLSEEVWSYFSGMPVLLKLLNHVKLIVQCERLYENIVQNTTSAFNK